MVLSLAFVFAMKSLKSVPRDETQAKPSFPSPSPLTYLMSAIDLLSKGNQVKGEHARPRGVRGLFQFPSLDTFTESETFPLEPSLLTLLWHLGVWQQINDSWGQRSAGFKGKMWGVGAFAGQCSLSCYFWWILVCGTSRKVPLVTPPYHPKHTLVIIV